MGSVLGRLHFEDTEKINALEEESAGPSELRSTPLEDRSETQKLGGGQACPTITSLATQAHTLCRIHIDRHP